MIYKCEGCKQTLSLPEFDEQRLLKIECWDQVKTDSGLCPRCALEWFKRLARGERAEWVTRGRR